MEIINDINSAPNCETILTIGFFDGVHEGHRFLLNHLQLLAEQEHLQSALLTFWPHPRKVLQESYQPTLLNTLEERNLRFAQMPTDLCFQIAFTPELAQLSAYDFMKLILKEKLHVKHLIIGYDHRFGHNRSEGFEEYCQYGQELGIKVTQAPAFQIDSQNISSSVIRRLISTGDLYLANLYLGYTYSLKGTIVHGKKIGRTIGFPTANLSVDESKCLPAIGVYTVRLWMEEKSYNGMACIGTRPTFEEEGEPSIEIHLFDFHQEIYGKQVRIEFFNKIREQKKFVSTNELIETLQNDEKLARQQLSELI